MEPTADELAGVVDLFGALTREELTEALSELAFKRAEEVEDPDGAIDDAVASYHLAVLDADDETLLAPGPAAFPELPAEAEDLPHILDVPERTVDQERLARAVENRFHEESAVAVQSDDETVMKRLLDVSYELEVWGPVDVADARERLTDAVDD